VKGSRGPCSNFNRDTLYKTLNRARKEASIELDACEDASLRARFGEKLLFFAILE